MRPKGGGRCDSPKGVGFPCSPKAVKKARPLAQRVGVPARTIASDEERQEKTSNGNWYCEVVQRREGLWLHHPGGRRRRLVLPPHRHPVRWLPQPGRRTARGV